MIEKFGHPEEPTTPEGNIDAKKIINEIRDELITLRHEWDSEQPLVMVDGKNIEHKENKHRTNWFSAVLLGLGTLLNEKLEESHFISKETEEAIKAFEGKYTSEDFTKRGLTTKEHIKEADDLIDKVLKDLEKTED